MVFNSLPNDQAMATPLAGASVDRGVDVEVRWSMENRRASGGCHPRLVRLVVVCSSLDALGTP